MVCCQPWIPRREACNLHTYLYVCVYTIYHPATLFVSGSCYQDGAYIHVDSHWYCPSTQIPCQSLHHQYLPDPNHFDESCLALSSLQLVRMHASGIRTHECMLAVRWTERSMYASHIVSGRHIPFPSCCIQVQQTLIVITRSIYM